MRFVFSPLALARFIMIHRPDIVHLNTSMDRKAYWRDLAYLFVAKLLNVKVVNQVHGGPMPQEFFAGHAVLIWLLRRALYASDAVSVLSSKEYEAYTAFCPGALIVRIPNAIDPAELLGDIAAPDAHRPLRLIYIGRIIREKGLFEVLEAMAQLQRSGRKLHLDIAGGGPAEKELRSSVLQLGLDDVVHFHGPVFGAAKTRLWRETDVLVFPTYHPEGLPYALLEAMAAGTPAITCPVAAIPDVMQDGVHGFFVPPRDADTIAGAIAALDNDRAMLDRMARASRARVLEKFTVERLARDFSELYGAVLGRRA
ncbi:glycosyltransferase [Undibacterium arcticum]|uniref:Glycosyltransferase n=2 Tax=Undibacterium arcticum TaxID=1762892 RepID=A0ABV7F2B4_9BURK